jgi:hypothetical protein
MPHSIVSLPTSTWGDLEAIFDSLAQTTEEKDTVHHLLTMTREMAPHLSKLDLLREIICIALVLLPVSDRPPEWPWLLRSDDPSSGKSLS